jgi:hypothetical protein
MRAERIETGEVLLMGTATVDQMLPVPWLYDISVAADLLPMTIDQLRRFLRRHRDEFPQRFRKRNDRRWVRVLLADEIRAIRRRYVKGKALDALLFPVGEGERPGCHVRDA